LLVGSVGVCPPALTSGAGRATLNPPKKNLRKFAQSVDIYGNVYILGYMNNTTNTTNALTDLINGMIAERRQFAADNGFVATDQEIADHIKASLIRMMKGGK